MFVKLLENYFTWNLVINIKPNCSNDIKQCLLNLLPKEYCTLGK